MPQKHKKLLKTIRTKKFLRFAEIDRRQVDEENRTFELSFSSEEPYERFFGTEILDHEPKSIRMDFLKSGRAPFLSDHSIRDQIGVIEKAKVSGRVGRATVRFGKSDRAEQEFVDVNDGIRSNTSVGYIIHEMILEKSGDDGDVYRVTDWEPLEISLVSIPADTTVGVGRGHEVGEAEFETKIFEMRSAGPDDEPDDDDRPTWPAKPGANTDDNSKKGGRTMPNKNKQAATPDDSFDADAARAEIRGELSKTIAEIMAIGEAHGFEKEASQAVQDGKSVEQFRSFVLDELSKRNLKPVPQDYDVNVGLNDSEKDRFSFLRLLRALADPKNRQYQNDAAFEFEVSEAFAKKSGKQPRGAFIPPDVLRRDLTVGTDSAGGYLVETEMRPGSFIDALRNKLITRQAGATFLTDLVGDLAIPKLSAGATAYWVAESGAPTESQQTIAQVQLAPKTVGAFTDLSRKLLLQSSIDVEMLVRNDLAKIIALAVDLAALHGSGSSNQPTGVASTSGIGSVAGGTNGAAPDWTDIVNLETEVAQDNADIGALAYITNAKVRGKLKRTAFNATYGDRYIWDVRAGDTPLNGYPAWVTNQVSSALTKGSSSGVCSAIFFGNWADLIIALWSGVDILVDPYTGSSTATVRVTAFQDADIGVRHAQSFSAMLDALTT